jgi:hypothetical protein
MDIVGKYIPKIKFMRTRRQISSNVPAQRLGEESTEIPTVSVQVSEESAVVTNETNISNTETFCRSSFSNFARNRNLRMNNR